MKRYNLSNYAQEMAICNVETDVNKSALSEHTLETR